MCTFQHRLQNVIFKSRPTRVYVGVQQFYNNKQYRIKTCALPEDASDVEGPEVLDEMQVIDDNKTLLPYLDANDPREESDYTWKEYMGLNVQGLYDEEELAEAEGREVDFVPTTTGRLLSQISWQEEATISADAYVETEVDPNRTLPMKPSLGDMTEWDLRAMMEKRKRKAQELTSWTERRSAVGRYTSDASDWRTDLRCQDTGDPTQPYYREWTHKEIWDLIVLRGNAVDPREVLHDVQDPHGAADAVEEGYRYKSDFADWLVEHGKVIQDADIDEVVDRDAEVALLASEFSDFEDFSIADTLPESSFDDGFSSSGDF